MKLIKIEMIHDLVCSWCHIGYHNISQALEVLSDEITVDFNYLPFELNPRLPETGVDIIEHLCQRNGWSQNQVMNYRRHLLSQTKEAGVVIDFNRRTHYYKTAKAHRLLIAAKKLGLHRKLHEVLMNAYHVEGADIHNTSILLQLSEKVGFDQNRAEKALTSAALGNNIKRLANRVRHFKVASVPAFIFNEKIFISGSNSAKYFEQILRKNFLY